MFEQNCFAFWNNGAHSELAYVEIGYSEALNVSMILWLRLLI